MLDTTDAETTAADGCASLGRDECQANAECAVIGCRAFTPDQGGQGFCLGDAEFIGCRRADATCDEMRTITCDGADTPVYACMDDCIPDGWMECDPPVDGMVDPC